MKHLDLPNIKKLTLGIALACSTVGPSYAQTNSEPPVNSFLADSPWPMSHRNSYNQASSPLRGIEPGDTVKVGFKRALPSITLAYANDSVAWGSTLAS